MKDIVTLNSLKKKLLLIVGTAVSLVITLIPRTVTVKSEGSFDRLISRHEIAVVMFYREDRTTGDDSTLKKNINATEYMFKNVEKKGRYKEVNIAFIKVNIARDFLDDVAKRFAVKKVPAFVLFKDGVPVRDKEKNMAMVTGFISRADLINFIEKHLDDDLQEIIDEKEEIRQRRREEAQSWSYYNYPYYYPHYGYGYGYWPYYQFGGGFRFGGGRRFRGHRHGGGIRRGGIRRGGARGGGIRRGGMRGGGMRRGSGMRGGGMRRGGARGGGGRGRR